MPKTRIIWLKIVKRWCWLYICFLLKLTHPTSGRHVSRDGNRVTIWRFWRKFCLFLEFFWKKTTQKWLKNVNNGLSGKLKIRRLIFPWSWFKQTWHFFMILLIFVSKSFYQSPETYFSSNNLLKHITWISGNSANYLIHHYKSNSATSADHHKVYRMQEHESRSDSISN